MQTNIRFGLKFQFALLTLFLICATAGISGYLTLKRERQILENQIVAKGEAMALGLASNCAEALLPKPDDLYLATLIKETVTDKTIGYALLVDRKGKIIAHSDLSMWGTEYIEPSRKVRNPVDKSYIDIATSKTGQPFYDFSAPILVARTSQLGTVHIGIPVQLVTNLLRDSRNRLMAVALALLGVGIAVSMTMAGLIMRPIQKLANGAERIGKGDLEYRIKMSRRDEFGLLASSFNSMASNLSEMYLNTLQMLANALEAKDVYSRGHTERVTGYAVEIAKKMNLPESEVEIIRKASMIHDIGKIGIRESILNKPDSLTDEEYEHIKTHVAWGAHILKPITSLASVISCLYHHHERYDGTGYPSGICSADIPLGARIIAVADTFDAMTTDRPYRKALPVGEAVAELRSCSGTQFDPQVVRTFIEIAKKMEEEEKESSIEEEIMASIS
jgi:response regulator RpfG family c-di-GMP phosphodiesterase